ncbi:MAG: hypothetical protein EXX96DRAFT_472255 [Benjaminiella poitrasii]|nr:MAG: hypothetical protein EXX96DRAFT_472255 [Benjaminiella poitrasii]
MIDNVPKSPLSPSSSSSSLGRHPTSTPDCPCRHILVSKDSEHCALCDSIIPSLHDIQHDRDRKRQTIAELEARLEQGRRRTEPQRLRQLERESDESRQRLVETEGRLRSLQQDMRVLQTKYEAEKQEAERAQRAKQDVENELEELSRRLFEEANGMVADEKRQKHALTVQHEHLRRELDSCRAQMEAEEEQLRELKEKMQQQQQQQTTGAGDQRARRDMANLLGQRLSCDDDHQVVTDPAILEEFREFVESDVPLRKMNSIPYLKTSVMDDVEPCLRFARLSAKKLCEAIANNSCFIEEAPIGYAQEQLQNRPADQPQLKISVAKTLIWERLSAGLSFAGCQACGRIDSGGNLLRYRFRVSFVDDWACIDRYCRDRLVSVCEFYSFARNVRQGYYNVRTIEDLYEESVRLKLQMFYARMGTLSGLLHQMGIEGDAVGHASKLDMTIPSPSPVIDKSLTEESQHSIDLPTDESSKDDINSNNQEGAKEHGRRSSTHPEKSVWLEHSY